MKFRFGCIEVRDDEKIFITKFYQDQWCCVKGRPRDYFILDEWELLSKPSNVYWYIVALYPYTVQLQTEKGVREVSASPITVKELADRLNLKTEWLALQVAMLKWRRLPPEKRSNCTAPPL